MILEHVDVLVDDYGIKFTNLTRRYMHLIVIQIMSSLIPTNITIRYLIDEYQNCMLTIRNSINFSMKINNNRLRKRNKSINNRVGR